MSADDEIHQAAGTLQWGGLVSVAAVVVSRPFRTIDHNVGMICLSVLYGLVGFLESSSSEITRG